MSTSAYQTQRNAKWLASGFLTSPGGVLRAARFYATAWPEAATYSAATLTFTADANGAMGDIDSTAPAVGDRVVYVAGGSSDGIYQITSLGGASAKWTATRVADLNSSADFVNANASTVAIFGGSANVGKVLTMSIASTFAMDSDSPTFTASSSAVSYAAVATALNLASGSTNLDLSGSSGTFKPPSGLWTWQGKQAATATANVIADPGDAAAIAVTASGVCALTTAGAETRTVAIPTFVGQTLTLVLDTDGGDCVVTFASDIDQSGNDKWTANDAGDCISLVGVTIGGTRAWRLLHNVGGALS